MDLNNGDNWTTLLSKGIIDVSLLRLLWLGQHYHFDFLVTLMLKVGIFGMLHGGGKDGSPGIRFPV